ncbi:MAG: shikimate dehydrogenase [Flavobacteriaceae bacterium]|nr:shikimate dehydrogenase [Flavobacteriaceae bacterium]
MSEKVKFGLIGKNISYSFSKKYFEDKFKNLSLENYSYELFDIDKINDVERIFDIPNLKGLNVTIPYKEQIIPFLDELSPEAEKIGAINCISIVNGKKTGYNTDVFGFEKSLLAQPKCLNNRALILGNGGAVKAVKYVLEKYEIPYTIVSRKSELNFENIDNKLISENKIIVQCTPVGTFPNVKDALPFPFEGLSLEHFVIDLIYNPARTLFLKKAEEKGAKTLNGLLMLEQQAEKAWEIWNLM